tara:strand:- start:322 stop:750 length:429 start_codon:yes stop_codon:yes gene_type:complete
LEDRKLNDTHDIVDEIALTPLRFILKHAWVFADYAFKLTGWMLGASAVLALGQKSDNQPVLILGICLSAVWGIALAATLFRLAGFLQDKALEKVVHSRAWHPLVRIALSSLLTGIVVIPVLQSFFVLVGLFVTIVTDLNILS